MTSKTGTCWVCLSLNSLELQIKRLWSFLMDDSWLFFFFSPWGCFKPQPPGEQNIIPNHSRLPWEQKSHLMLCLTLKDCHSLGELGNSAWVTISENMVSGSTSPKWKGGSPECLRMLLGSGEAANSVWTASAPAQPDRMPRAAPGWQSQLGHRGNLPGLLRACPRRVLIFPSKLHVY